MAYEKMLVSAILKRDRRLDVRLFAQNISSDWSSSQTVKTIELTVSVESDGR